MTEPQREQMHAVREQIRQLLDGGKADPGRGRPADDPGARPGPAAPRVAHKQAFEKFAAQLTPEQKAKLDQMKQESNT
mgnify:CR=1 FL=1